MPRRHVITPFPMPDYPTIKLLHVAFASVSGVLFFARGILMLAESPALRQRWLRVVPHVNDTLLLTAGIWLAVHSHQSPLAHPWLAAKLTALFAYIGLGMVALRWGPTKRARVCAWVAALAVFVYMLAVAARRSPWPFT